MHIALLNLMPEKIKTETQIARLVGSTPLQVEMTLVKTSSYTPTTTSSEHMLAFYEPWSAIAHDRFDGLIITGAPVEEMEFEVVDYWVELTEIFDWARTNVSWVFNLCWAGQAALYHHYGIPKYGLARKLSGAFGHRVVRPNSELLRGLADTFRVPVSRHTEPRRADIEKFPNLSILAESDASGLCLIEDRALNHAHMFNHLEYDTETLANEYRRDIKAGRNIHVPENYFPGDDVDRSPVNSWRGHGHLLFANWINTMYQTAPVEVSEIGATRSEPDAAPRARGSAAAG